MAITGMSRRFASRTAMISRLASTTKTAPGSRLMSFTPERYFSSFCRSRSRRRRSFLV